MTGQIIRLPGSVHRDVQHLLPWYVTGQLDAADTARVAAHLDDCDECAAQVEVDRRLDRAITRVPGDVEQGWAAISARLDAPSVRARDVRADDPDRRAASPRHARRATHPGWRWIGAGVAAQLAVASLIGVLLIAPEAMPARFHALGAPPTLAATGNLIVVFRPETSEQRLRAILRDSGARLVDGPTAANAYVLAVPAARRATLLPRLRGAPEIVLAEPIDANP